VSFETGCPEERIETVRKYETIGSGSCELRACDQELKYGRTGSVFQKID
jgi:hypothetical protein